MTNNAIYWRVRNLGDCGWRPAVSRLAFFADARGSEPLEFDEVICSGWDTEHGDRSTKGPQLAVDGDSKTAWRPPIHAPRAFQVWIGARFSNPVAVSMAIATGLGVGEGGGQKWSGGIQLQSSDDGKEWTTIGQQQHYDWISVAQQDCDVDGESMESMITVVATLLSGEEICTVRLSVNATTKHLCAMIASRAATSGMRSASGRWKLLHGQEILRSQSLRTLTDAGFSDGEVVLAIPWGRALYWRLRNLGDCGWRPAVSRLAFFADAQGNELLEFDEVICSGWDTEHGDRSTKGPQLAVDGDSKTAWRPPIHAPRAFQVWIGARFSNPVAVSMAVAIGLGVGEGGGQKWSGGIELQSSDDGTEWTTIAQQPQSDTIVFGLCSCVDYATA